MESARIGTLLEQAGRGDQSAWQAIVDEYANLVWGVVRRYRLSNSDAADAVQTTWLRLVEHLGAIREPACLPGWLRTTASRACLEIARSGGRERPEDRLEVFEFGGRPGQPSGVDGPEAHAVRSDQQRAVRAAVALLPDRDRLLLELLADGRERSYREISSQLGMPIGSIGPTRARVLARLRGALEAAGTHDAALS